MTDHDRRLPIYLLIDISESMVGEPLDGVEQGINLLFNNLKGDPRTIETAWISVITFARRARQVIPLTEVIRLSPPNLAVGPGTSLGAALDLLSERISREVQQRSDTIKGDYRPLVFLLTDGMPTDDWASALKNFKKAHPKLGGFIALGCGEDVDIEILKQITPIVFVMRDVTSEEMQKFFSFVSQSVSTASVSADRGTEKVVLPDSGLEYVGGKGGSESGSLKTPSQVILAARCGDTNKGYLMRYRLIKGSSDVYQAEEKAYPIGEDYFGEAGISATGQKIDSSKLKGFPPCPYCARPAWTLGKDKIDLVCSDTGDDGGGGGFAQVMFVLDCTGSMGGEIEGIKQNIQNFMDYIKSEGLSVEAGLIAFRDLEMREPPEVLKFKGHPFTDDAGDFKNQVSRLRAFGGGSNPGESSFDALVLACRQPFKDDVSRILVLITDEPPLIPDGEVRSINDVKSAMSGARIDQIHLVITHYIRSFYSGLHDSVKGETFILTRGGSHKLDFERLIMDIGKSITVTTRLG